MHDSAVASVSPRARQASSTSASIGSSVREKRYDPTGSTRRGLERVGPGIRAGCDEEVDVDLAVAGADRHLDPLPFAARCGERLRDGRLADSVEPERAPFARLVPRRRSRRSGSVSSTAAQSS